MNCAGQDLYNASNTAERMGTESPRTAPGTLKKGICIIAKRPPSINTMRPPFRARNCRAEGFAVRRQQPSGQPLQDPEIDEGGHGSGQDGCGHPESVNQSPDEGYGGHQDGGIA